MMKRHTFQCWNCKETYTLLRDINSRQTVITVCPYCGEQAVLDLAPEARQIKTVMRGTTPAPANADLPPGVLPTRKP